MRHLSCKQTGFSCTPSTQTQHWLASQALATPEKYRRDLKGKMINDLITGNFPPCPPLPWVVEQEPHSKALALKIIRWDSWFLRPLPHFWPQFRCSFLHGGGWTAALSQGEMNPAITAFSSAFKKEIWQPLRCCEMLDKNHDSYSIQWMLTVSHLQHLLEHDLDMSLDSTVSKLDCFYTISISDLIEMPFSDILFFINHIIYACSQPSVLVPSRLLSRGTWVNRG